MRRLTKLMTLVVVAIMATVVMAGTAFAADPPAKNDSITVNNAKPGETYSAYKMFDLSVNSETAPTAYTYTINSGWTAFFGENGAGAAYITKNADGSIASVTDAAALAKAAAAWTGKPDAAKTVKVAADANTAVLSGLADGYWLITSTLGTNAMIETTPDANAVTINEKNPEDTIEKTVKEDSTGNYGEANDAQVGDTVEFKSTVKIVKGTRNVVVHDKMTSGLVYTAGSVAITGLTKGTEYAVNESPDDGDTFDITFTQSWIDTLDFGTGGFKEYEITYTAIITEAAIVTNSDGVALVDQNNKTHVSFGDGTNSKEDTTTTTTHKFNVFKHAKDSTENLDGAIFELKKNGTVVNLIKIDDNNYRVAKTGETGTVTTFTTVKEGDIVIWGVDSDNDYTLNETQAPSGYNKLTSEVEVTVGADNATRADVENNSGAELPSTGGIGTTILYIIGAVLVIGAGVFLVTKRRMRKEDNVQE